VTKLDTFVGELRSTGPVIRISQQPPSETQINQH